MIAGEVIDNDLFKEVSDLVWYKMVDFIHV